MELKGKSVLVIGGTGFLGSHIVEELLGGAVGEVVVFDNSARGKAEYFKHKLGVLPVRHLPTWR